MDISTWESQLLRCSDRVTHLRHGLQGSGARSDGSGAAGLDEMTRELAALDQALSSGRVRGAGSAEVVSALRSKLEKTRRDIQTIQQLSGKHGGKHAIIQLQDDALARQDAALDDISGQLSRVGNIGLGIRDEVDLQNGLLDDLDRGVSRGNQDVGAAAHDAGQVAANSGTCKYWMAIAALLAVLIVLLVV